MKWNRETILQILEKESALDLLSRALHGVERETLRITMDGDLALTPHPKALGDSMTHEYITTDFSESQLELITKPHDSIEAALNELFETHKKVAQGLDSELMWPFSMPGKLPPEDQIPVARYGDSPEAQKKEIYRKGLAVRYGKYMQLLCGIHYNLSFSDELWQFLHAHFGQEKEFQAFKNERSLALVRNFIRYRWLIAFLLGATPVKDPTYGCKGLAQFGHDEAVSLRLSRCGYDNPADVQISYNNFEEHLRDIETAMNTPYPLYTQIGIEKDGEQIQLNDHLLQIANEYYFPIRMKPQPHENGFFDGLKEQGVEYFELRLLDVNPHVPHGIDANELYLSHLFLLYCFLEESPEISAEELKHMSNKQQFVALHGQKQLPEAYNEEGNMLLEKLSELAAFFPKEYKDAIIYYTNEFPAPKTLMWKKALDEIAEFDNDFRAYGLNKAKQHFDTLMHG